MGVSITGLLPSKNIRLDDINGKIIAVDAPLFLYQFISTIRQRDGTPLMDSKGRVTSHLIGLFNRTIKMLEKGIKPIFVFDGKAPELKKKEQERRALLKEEAKIKYTKAISEEDILSMKKYAMRTSKLTPEMIKESKELLAAMGVPIIQAPSEGEAQASYLVKKGDAYAIASSDTDSLLFGAQRVIKNLAITGRRKKTKSLSYETVKPELIELDKVLNALGIDHDQFIVLCILVGTDYNPDGIKGIGPKRALDTVRKYKTDFDAMFSDMEWKKHFDFPWTDIFYLIKKMPVTDEYNIQFGKINKGEIIHLLVEEHDFSRERVESQLNALEKQESKAKQKGLGEFF